ncbi:unnamed protein product [Leuciscus chuanchicus]
MFKGTLAVLCGKVSGVGRLCSRERRDYSGYSEGGFRGSCGLALKAKQLADMHMLILSSAGGSYGKEVMSLELQMFLGHSCFANPCLDICICAALLVNDYVQVGEGLDFIQGNSIQNEWIPACGVYLENLGLISVNVKANLR